MLRLFLCLLATACFMARADAATGTGKRVALVIGNSQYRSVDRLPNSAADARLIAQTLKDKGFDLVGGGAQIDLDHDTMARAVESFGHGIAGADVALFYYSGHGLQVRGVNWLVPVDANPTRPQDLDFQMVDADLVLRQMDGAGTKLNIVLLDACRNNPFAAGGVRAIQSGLAEMRAPEGTLISYATQPGNVAADGSGSDSPYTIALADSMKQPGLDVFRLFNQVGLQVKRTTGGAQQPWVSSSPIDGDFFFTPASVATPQPAPPAPRAAAEPATQVAGLVQPPPALAERAVLPGPTPPCSVLAPDPAGDRTVLRGIAIAGRPWEAFLHNAQATRGLQRLDASAVTVLPPFACGAVEALADALRSGRTDEPAGFIRMEQTSFVPGDAVVVTLPHTGPLAVRVDEYFPEGGVRHIAVRPPGTEADDRRLSFRITQTAKPSKRALVVIATRAAIDVGDRPTTEPAAVYLEAVRRAMPPDGRADIALLDVHPAVAAEKPTVATSTTTPVTAPPPVAPRRDPRCAAILQRGQLGEPLGDADRAFLRASCR